MYIMCPISLDTIMCLELTKQLHSCFIGKKTGTYIEVESSVVHENNVRKDNFKKFSFIHMYIRVLYIQ